MLRISAARDRALISMANVHADVRDAWREFTPADRWALGLCILAWYFVVIAL